MVTLSNLWLLELILNNAPLLERRLEGYSPDFGLHSFHFCQPFIRLRTHSVRIDKVILQKNGMILNQVHEYGIIHRQKFSRFKYFQMMKTPLLSTS